MLRDILRKILVYSPKEYNYYELLEDDQEKTDPTKASHSAQVDPSPSSSDSEEKATIISTDLNSNFQRITEEFDVPNNHDIKIRRVKIGKTIDSFIVYIEGMIDKALVSNFVIRQLIKSENFQNNKLINNPSALSDYICENVISANDVYKTNLFKEIILRILTGDVALFINGADQCLVVDAKGFEKRALDKPTAEGGVLGSQEAFTENMKTNISLVRKIIKNQNLKSDLIKVSKTNQAFCSLMYIDGIVNKQIVDEVKKRLSSLDVGFILSGSMLSQYIEDSSITLFPQVLHTERPDRASSFILEGRVALIVDGSPFVTIVPVTFFDFIKAEEDTDLRWQYASFLRIIRFFGIVLTIFAPAFYIAISLFHNEAIPTELLIAMSISKEDVPFPTVIEILMLEVAFELIREGGIRVPGVIGQTLGIVGALILGQAAVAAKLVSPILIIVVAITGLGSFAIPNYSLSIGLRILRFYFIFMASILGFLGIAEGIVLVGCILCFTKSFGVPLLAPFSPTTQNSYGLIMKKPVQRENMRPDYLNVHNKKSKDTSLLQWANKERKKDSN